MKHGAANSTRIAEFGFFIPQICFKNKIHSENFGKFTIYLAKNK